MNPYANEDAKKPVTIARIVKRCVISLVTRLSAAMEELIEFRYASLIDPIIAHVRENTRLPFEETAVTSFNLLFMTWSAGKSRKSRRDHSRETRQTTRATIPWLAGSL
jgi:hypothetical protein